MALSKITNNMVSVSGVPADSIIQIVEDSTTVYETTASTDLNAQKTSALSVNITPTSTSSKILVMVNLQTYNNTSGNSTYYNLFKDGSELTTAGNAMRHYIASGSGVMASGFNYLDSPATTSQITYDIRYYVSGGTGSISVNQGQSSIIAMEIAG